MVVNEILSLFTRMFIWCEPRAWNLLQEELVKFLPDDGTKQSVGERLLNPEELIKLCLEMKISELSLCAFDVFAWTSSSFRKAHKKLLEECWKNAADLDDWTELYQASTIEGWSDDETLQNLKHTVLFKASSRCYGPLAETFGEGFDQVLPLRLETLEPTIMKDSGSSVEAILMQHKDYPEAGKLMLTAIMLGSLEDDNGEEEGGPTPMEWRWLESFMTKTVFISFVDGNAVV